MTSQAVGVVGMGLMGTSISACLLGAGHRLFSVDHRKEQHKVARRRLQEFLVEMDRQGVSKYSAKDSLKRFHLSEDYRALASCALVVESISEDTQKKREVIGDIEQVVSSNTLIASNTSAIPITILQHGTRHPERILGIHWAEPAHITRFLEIICGERTSPKNGLRALALAEHWGKEPSLLKKDIRGFITNRIFYAMVREAFYLLDKKIATAEDIDRSIRNDLGYWITLAGPFRFMDLTGLPAYLAVMRGLFPQLSCAKSPSHSMVKLIQSGACGISNAKGFYPYSKKSAHAWEKLFMKFNYDIRTLATKYRGATMAIEQSRKRS